MVTRIVDLCHASVICWSGDTEEQPAKLWLLLRPPPVKPFLCPTTVWSIWQRSDDHPSSPANPGLRDVSLWSTARFQMRVPRVSLIRFFSIIFSLYVSLIFSSIYWSSLTQLLASTRGNLQPRESSEISPAHDAPRPDCWVEFNGAQHTVTR